MNTLSKFPAQVKETTNGFFKAMRNPETMELVRANPLAFTLAYVIAFRARWRAGFNRHGLDSGEALIGDYEAIGMTHQEYRTARAQLAKWKFATFKSTSRGTIAKLTDTRLFDVFGNQGNKQTNKPATISQQLTKTSEERKENSDSSYLHTYSIENFKISSSPAKTSPDSTASRPKISAEERRLGIEYFSKLRAECRQNAPESCNSSKAKTDKDLMKFKT